MDQRLGHHDVVEAGKLDLDAPVATYLKRWTLPESEFDNSKIPVRRLLSHMAGLTDGLVTPDLRLTLRCSRSKNR